MKTECSWTCLIQTLRRNTKAYVEETCPYERGVQMKEVCFREFSRGMYLDLNVSISSPIFANFFLFWLIDGISF